MEKIVEVVAAVIRRGGKILIASRKNEGWEFPGGKIEPGETPAAALRRELEEELSIRNALMLDEIYQIRHAYPDKTVHLHFLRTLLSENAEIVPREGQQVRWVEPPELFTCGLLPADRPLADFLNERRSRRPSLQSGESVLSYIRASAERSLFLFELKTQIGVKSFSFREIKDNSACADTIRYCASTVVDLSGTHVNYDDPASWAGVIAAYRAKGITISGIGAVQVNPDEAWNRRFFDFAKQAGAQLVSITFQMEDWEKSVASIEKLTEEYQIPAAIHNHGGYNWLGNSTALEYVFKRSSNRLGLCLDTAWCIHTERENPVEWMEKFGDRTYGFHFKDFTWDRNGRHCDAIVGEGALDLKAVLAKFKELDTVRSAVLEYEGKDAIECTKKSIENIRNLY